MAIRRVQRGRNQGRSQKNRVCTAYTLEEARAVSELLEPGDERLVLVDVTPVDRTRNFHNFSLETPEFFDDLFLRFTSQTRHRSRALYPLETPAGSRYRVLTRGR